MSPLIYGNPVPIHRLQINYKNFKQNKNKQYAAHQKLYSLNLQVIIYISSLCINKVMISHLLFNVNILWDFMVFISEFCHILYWVLVFFANYSNLIFVYSFIAIGAVVLKLNIMFAFGMNQFLVTFFQMFLSP